MRQDENTSHIDPRASLPFSPGSIPFFYGWVIVGVGTIGVLMSIPGQTMGVSVFTDFLVDMLDLSRVQLSIAYLVGTTSSALILSRAGRFFDRYGARATALPAALGLGLVLLYLTQIDRTASVSWRMLPSVPPWIPSFVLISIGFWGIRFFGQGVLTMASNNMVVKWFDRKRGLAVGLMGTFMSFGFSAAPRLLDMLVQSFGWRGAWYFCAIVIGGAFPVVVLILFRDNPEQCGLAPDGPGRPRIHTGKHDRRGPVSPAGAEASATLQEARRTYAFWVFAGALFLFALYMTGLTFHVVSVFAEAGMDRTIAVSIFFPASILSVAVRLFAGFLSDHVKLKYLLMAYLVGIILSCVAAMMLAPGAAVWVMIAGNGIAGGMFGLLSALVWPQFYGRRHLGAITGFVMAVQVAGSALGPYVFSLSFSATGGYGLTAAVCLTVAAALCIASVKADKPAKPR